MGFTLQVSPFMLIIMKRTLKILLIVITTLFLICVTVVLCINLHIKNSVKDNIVDPKDAETIENADCILILGCGVREDGTPSHMLHDRLERGIELYKQGVAPKILMSGDHGTAEYDEVNTMKQYAIDAGVPSEDIFMDHAGFNTYDSMYRAREIFKVKRLVIVTQKYHLYRALYVADSLGLEAFGINADLREYVGQWTRDIREVAARIKDFVITLYKPLPVCLGEKIPISGDGNQTNDKEFK